MSQAMRLGAGLVALALVGAGCGGQTGGGGTGGSTGGTGGGGAGGSTGGTGGNCTPQISCASDEYCDYPDNRCGTGGAGKCVKRPQGCTLLYAPVCACNGSVAGNECSAQSSGYDVNANATCTPPAGMFACGTTFCNVGSQYCLHFTSDVGGTPDSFSCSAPPASCGATPTCACLAGEPCGSLCAADAAGNLTLTCPGG